MATVACLPPDIYHVSEIFLKRICMTCIAFYYKTESNYQSGTQRRKIHMYATSHKNICEATSGIFIYYSIIF
jgi:hypothetical protein